MAKEDIEKLVSDWALEILRDTNIDLVDVEFVRERDWYLRVYLDKAGGIEIDDCQMVSEKLETLLDAKDPIRESYYLEVSSPGLDRPLKKEKDFIRHKGSKVEVAFFVPKDGKKQLIGVLMGHTPETLTLLVGDEEVVVNRQDVAMVRLHLEF